MDFSRKKTMLWWAVGLLIFLVVFSLLFPTNYVALSVSETELAAYVQGTDFRFEVGLDEIASLDCVELTDYGTAVSSQTKNRLTWGVYQSEVLGSYTLMVTQTTSTVIILGTADGRTLVFNYHSDQDTQDIYTALLPVLEEN